MEKRNIKLSIIKLLAIVMLICAVFLFAGHFNAFADTAPSYLSSLKKADFKTGKTLYRDTWSNQGYYEAVVDTNEKVILDQDVIGAGEVWTPLDNATLQTYFAETETSYYNQQVERKLKTSYHLPAGNYYLTEDIILNGSIVIGGVRTAGQDLTDLPIEMDTCLVNLSLNGKMISCDRANSKYKHAYSVIEIYEGGTLNLFDDPNAQEVHSVNGYDNKTHDYKYNEIKGGVITGGVAPRMESGGGMSIYGGNFNMYGGTIAGNTISCYYCAGGIQVNGSGYYIGTEYHAFNGCFNMFGGAISNNHTTKTGGGVDAYGFGQFIMYDGKISSNFGSECGGGAAATYGGCFVMKGGLITDNGTGTAGGGVGSDGSRNVVIEGGTISNNMSYSFGGGAGMHHGGSIVMKGGTIENNTASSGGGISPSTYSGGILFLEGGTIKNNTAKQFGGGIFTPTGSSYVILGATDGSTSVIDVSQNKSEYINGEQNLTLYPYTTAKIQGDITGSEIGLSVGYIEPEDGYQLVEPWGSYIPTFGASDDIFKYDKADKYSANYSQKYHKITLTTPGNEITEGHMCENIPTVPGGWIPVYQVIQKNEITGVITVYFQVGSDQLHEGDTIENGYYYLASDIEVIQDIKIENDVHICLNGHTITVVDPPTGMAIPPVDSTNHDAVFQVKDGGSFTLYGHIVNNEVSYGIWDDINGDFEIDVVKPNAGEYTSFSSGYITGGVCGVEVLNGGSFTMLGGVIAGNVGGIDTTDDSVDNGYGGGVCVEEGATFTQLGGNIIGNTSPTGGGVYIASKGAEIADATLTGGTINDNRATTGAGIYLGDGSSLEINGDIAVINNDGLASSTGGGVYVGVGSEFSMSDGMISGNRADNGGGVYAKEDVTLSGSANISSNKDSSPAGITELSTRSNLYLESGKQINIPSEFKSGAHIGVLTADNPTVGVDVVLDGIDSQATAHNAYYIVSDNRKYVAVAINTDDGIDGNAQIVLTEGSIGEIYPHECPVFGDCEHSGNHTWEVILTLDQLNNMEYGKHYYLAFDMVITDTITIGAPISGGADQEINLCLNGNKLEYIGHSDSPIFEIENGAHLHVHGNANVAFYGGWNADGVYEVSETPTAVLTDELLGGVITSASSSYGHSAVHILSGGEFSMCGGSIVGNSATKGGGIHVEEDGMFDFHGGIIAGNYGKTGGGIYMEKGAKANIHGGAIIKSNVTGFEGGGIYCDGEEYWNEQTPIDVATRTETLQIGDNAYIYGNYSASDRSASNVHLQSSFISISSPIKNAKIGVSRTLVLDDTVKKYPIVLDVDLLKAEMFNFVSDDGYAISYEGNYNALIIGKRVTGFEVIKRPIDFEDPQPTTTITPTTKPTTPVPSTTIGGNNNGNSNHNHKVCWLCGKCPMFLGICLWIWLAIIIIVSLIISYIIYKKCREDDEDEKKNENEQNQTNKMK